MGNHNQELQFDFSNCLHIPGAVDAVVNSFFISSNMCPGLSRESCLLWLSYMNANFLVSPAACGLVLSLDLQSEKKRLTNGMFL